MEIKDGSKPASKRSLTPKELVFRTQWRGQYDVVHSPQESLDLVNMIVA
jgi:hypothetical protein